MHQKIFENHDNLPEMRENTGNVYITFVLEVVSHQRLYQKGISEQLQVIVTVKEFFVDLVISLSDAVLLCRALL